MHLINPSQPARPEPWQDRDIADRAGEEWRSVVNYDGLYEVSSHGRVKSVRRLDNRNRWREERIRAQTCANGAAYLGLSQEGISTSLRVMQLVAEAFLPSKPAGHIWYHRNKNPFDNQVTNITSGTWSTSSQVAYAVGTNRLDIAKGHEYKRQQRDIFYQEHGRWQDGQLVALTCACCHTERPLEDFRRKRGSARTLRMCRACKLEKMGVQKPGFLPQHRDLREQGLRTCSICKETKPLATDFGKNTRSVSGYLHRCRVCHNAASKASKAKQAKKQQEANPGE